MQLFFFVSFWWSSTALATKLDCDTCGVRCCIMYLNLFYAAVILLCCNFYCTWFHFIITLFFVVTVPSTIAQTVWLLSCNMLMEYSFEFSWVGPYLSILTKYLYVVGDSTDKWEVPFSLSLVIRLSKNRTQCHFCIFSKSLSLRAHWWLQKFKELSKIVSPATSVPPAIYYLLFSGDQCIIFLKIRYECCHHQIKRRERRIRTLNKKGLLKTETCIRQFHRSVISGSSIC